MQVIEFILSNWKNIVLAYVLIGFALFILTEIWWIWVIGMGCRNKEKFPEYYDDGEAVLGIALVVVAIIGLIAWVFWLLILIAIPFLMLMDWIQRTHPRLLGNMSEDIKERDNDRENN